MLSESSIASPDEVNPQDRVFVAPFADGLAAIGDDDAVARCAEYKATVCVIGN